MWFYMRMNWGDYIIGAALLREEHLNARAGRFYRLDEDEPVLMRDYHRGYVELLKQPGVTGWMSAIKYKMGTRITRLETENVAQR